METLNRWAEVLKNLRETEKKVLLGVISNLPVTFTSDAIIVTAPNKSVFEMLESNKKEIGGDIVKIKLKNSTETFTLEKKLENLFGDKLTVQ